jgi:acyl carrier protein
MTNLDGRAVSPYRPDVLSVVVAMAPRPAGPVSDDTRLIGDLGYDSLRLIELSIALEQRFGLRSLDDDAVATVSTVGDVVELVTVQSRAA